MDRQVILWVLVGFIAGLLCQVGKKQQSPNKWTPTYLPFILQDDIVVDKAVYRNVHIRNN